MRKIKSERAADRLNDHTTISYTMYVFSRELIYLAEQDAEERAIKAFKEWLKEANPYWAETPEGREAIAKFKQLLKGGQEDE